MGVLTDLKALGVEDILITATDKGNYYEPVFGYI